MRTSIQINWTLIIWEERREIKENEKYRINVKDDDSFILENPGDNYIPGTPTDDADPVSLISKRPK